MAAAPPHPDAAYEEIEETPQVPEPRREVPPLAAADPLDRSERPLGPGRHLDLLPVHQPGTEAPATPGGRLAPRGDGIAPTCGGHFAVFRLKGARDGLPDGQGTHRKGPQGRAAVDDGFIAQAPDELLADPGVERGHEAQPQARETRRQEWHRNHEAAHPDLPGIFVHEPAVADPVGTADFEDSAFLSLELQAADEIGDHVVDRDRLGRCPHPARGDHHRQLVHERPDHFERQRPGADHDGGPELHHLGPFGRQDAADLLAAPQVRREFAPAEATEIDDPPDSPLPRGAGEVPGAGPVLLLEVAGCPHGVHEVVGGVDAVQRSPQGVKIQNVAADDPGLRSEALREELRAAGQTADPVAAGLEGRHEPASHVTTCAGDEDEGRRGSVSGWDDRRPFAAA